MGSFDERGAIDESAAIHLLGPSLEEEEEEGCLPTLVACSSFGCLCQVCGEGSGDWGGWKARIQRPFCPLVVSPTPSWPLFLDPIFFFLGPEPPYDSWHLSKFGEPLVVSLPFPERAFLYDAGAVAEALFSALLQPSWQLLARLFSASNKCRLNRSLSGIATKHQDLARSSILAAQCSRLHKDDGDEQLGCALETLDSTGLKSGGVDLYVYEQAKQQNSRFQRVNPSHPCS